MLVISTVIWSQNDEMPIGWPLGLGFLNMRLRVGESFPTASMAPYQLHVPSTSFSSFSSSNLDTEVLYSYSYLTVGFKICFNSLFNECYYFINWLNKYYHSCYGARTIIMVIIVYYCNAFVLQQEVDGIVLPRQQCIPCPTDWS